MNLKLLRLLGIAGLCLRVQAGAAHALEVSPIYGLQVLGGQYFFGGDRGTLSGNVSGVVAPAMKFNDEWALLPSLNSSYQGTKTVVDLVGAGTLFQEQMDHRLAARAVYTPGGGQWRLKPSLSYKYQLLKETKDEDWGEGLFDYRKWSAGLDAEYVYHDPFSLHAGVDYFETSFPNYTSLESQAATQFQGQSLARELVGDFILDTQNASLSIGGDGPIYERLILDGNAVATYQHFPNQHVVDGAGQLTPLLREDLATTVTLGARMPRELNSDLRTLGGLDLGLSYTTSNQNNYDARQARFFPLYYNYGELRVSPSFKLLIGPPREAVVLGLSATWWHRRYPYRVIQDEAGAYLDQKLRTDNSMISASLTYPMAKHFSLLFNFQYGKTISNQRYESFYSYNYSVTNYLFGFSYDY